MSVRCEDDQARTLYNSLLANQRNGYLRMDNTRGARELGKDGLDQFRETKHVHWDFNLEDKEY